uniref:Uncharacterized protein n=1 Tax=Cacopsylla melanoneura TaxID=428564 RepID=A0A8D8VQQ9_9HEMI
MHSKPTGQQDSVHQHSIDIFEETISPTIPVQSCSNEILHEIECLPNEIPKNKKVQKDDKNVYLIGDSIAASIKNIIVQKSPTDTHIVDFSRGGATIGSVSKAFQMEVLKEDMAILIVGTNDLFRTKWDEIKTAFVSMLNKLQKCKTVFIVQICRRYDTPRINKHITKLNTRIKHLVKTWNNVKIIHTKYIKYENVSEDGIHLNNTGKNKMAHKIITSLFPDIQSKGLSENYRNGQNKGSQKSSAKNDGNKHRKSNKHNISKNKQDFFPSHYTKKTQRRSRRGDHRIAEENDPDFSGTYWTQKDKTDPKTSNGYHPSKATPSLDSYINRPAMNEMVHFPHVNQPPTAGLTYRPPVFQQPSKEWVHHEPTNQLPPNGWSYQQRVRQPPFNSPVFHLPFSSHFPTNDWIQQHPFYVPSTSGLTGRQSMEQPPINEPGYFRDLVQPPFNGLFHHQPINEQVYHQQVKQPPTNRPFHNQTMNQPPINDQVYRQEVNQPPSNVPVYHQPPSNEQANRQHTIQHGEQQLAPPMNQIPVNNISTGQNFLNMRQWPILI